MEKLPKQFLYMNLTSEEIKKFAEEWTNASEIVKKLERIGKG